MFDIGLQEMLVIGVLALLVFGPSKLPELGRMVGRAMREFRRASDEFRTTVETNLHINEPDAPPPPEPATVEPAFSTEALETPSAARVEEATPAPESGTAAEVTEPYIASRGGKLFHRRECQWNARIAEADRVYLKRVADARDQGFTECPACEPWEPA
ncbi:MAG: twin-arginine translocase TatA/TatE family subunit [Candidatus Rokuibacteriota bacterium]